jgi:hypothetical protein
MTSRGSAAAPSSRIASVSRELRPHMPDFLAFLFCLKFAAIPVRFATMKQKREEGEAGSLSDGRKRFHRMAGDPGDQGFDPLGDSHHAPLFNTRRRWPSRLCSMRRLGLLDLASPIRQCSRVFMVPLRPALGAARHCFS